MNIAMVIVVIATATYPRHALDSV